MEFQGVTAYGALKKSNVKPGQFVAITGAGGGLGSFAIQYAKAMGMRVIALDIGSEKGKHCRQLGAEFFVDPSVEPDVVGTIRKLTNGGPHGVTHFATSEKPLEQAIHYVRTRGTVVAVSLPKDAKLNANVFWVVYRAITIKGSFIGTRKDTDEAIDFFARGLIDVPVEIVTLADLEKVYNLMINGQIKGRYVLDLTK